MRERLGSGSHNAIVEGSGEGVREKGEKGVEVRNEWNGEVKEDGSGGQGICRNEEEKNLRVRRGREDRRRCCKLRGKEKRRDSERRNRRLR